MPWYLKTYDATHDNPEPDVEVFEPEYTDWWLHKTMNLEQWQIDRMLVELSRLLINTPTAQQMSAYDKWLHTHLKEVIPQDNKRPPSLSTIDTKECRNHG